MLDYSKTIGAVYGQIVKAKAHVPYTRTNSMHIWIRCQTARLRKDFSRPSSRTHNQCFTVHNVQWLLFSNAPHYFYQWGNRNGPWWSP